jgi:hypothetical protein
VGWADCLPFRARAQRHEEYVGPENRFEIFEYPLSLLEVQAAVDHVVFEVCVAEECGGEVEGFLPGRKDDAGV